MRRSLRRRRVIVVLAAMMLWTATSAESCSNSLKSASQAITRAQQSLDALNATCNQLNGNPSAQNSFAAQVASDANLPNQPVSVTEGKALADMNKLCGSAANSSFQPYSQVLQDLQGIP